MVVRGGRDLQRLGLQGGGGDVRVRRGDRLQRRDSAPADGDDDWLGATGDEQVLLQAGVVVVLVDLVVVWRWVVVADRPVLAAAVAPGDVSDDGGLRVEGCGWEADRQRLRGAVGRLDHSLRGCGGFQAVDAQWRWERKGGGGEGAAAVDGLAQQDSAFFCRWRRQSRLLRVGPGRRHLVVVAGVVVGRQHGRGPERRGVAGRGKVL